MKHLFVLLPVMFLIGCGGFHAINSNSNSGQGQCLHPIHVSWNAPTANTDGTPLTDLAGFQIYWGLSSGNYGSSVAVVDPNATTYTLCNFTPATYYFAMTAYAASGNQSSYSNEVPFTLAASSSQFAAVYINLTSQKISTVKP